MSAHDDYLDPDRAGLNGPQAYRLDVEIPEALNHIEGVYWDEDGNVVLNLNPTPNNTEYLAQKIGEAEEEDEAVKVAKGYLHRYNVFPMPVFHGGGDGAHCGLGDWYDKHEKELEAALASGRPFDTGWYSSKKEIASARITSCDGKTVSVEVSVSDDFDTHGGARDTCINTMEAIRQTIYEVWDEAGQDQENNREYRGYSLIHWSTKIYWKDEEDKRKRYGKKRPQCIDYLIVPACQWEALDYPPGDCYFYWGWQNDDEGEGADCKEEGVSKRTAKRFREFAERHEIGSLRIGDWEIKSWEKPE